MKKVTLSVLIFLSLIAYHVSRLQVVFAQSYGTGEQVSNQLTINKEVINPITNIFVENLGSADPTFSPGSTVTFHLTVRNGSSRTVDNISINDTLPQFVIFVKAVFIDNNELIKTTYNTANRVVTIPVGTLSSGQSRVIEMTATVVSRNDFPADRSVFCVTNYALITSGNLTDDDDASQFCLRTELAGAKYLPVAGFNDLLALIPFLSLGGIGGLMLLNKKK